MADTVVSDMVSYVIYTYLKKLQFMYDGLRKPKHVAFI